MLETSKDILNLVIALCIFFVTVFLVWSLYYLAQILKSSKEMVEEIRNKVEEFGDILTTLKDKITHSTTILTTVAKGVTDLLSMYKNKKSKNDDYEEEYEDEEVQEKPKRRKKRRK